MSITTGEQLGMSTHVSHELYSSYRDHLEAQHEEMLLARAEGAQLVCGAIAHDWRPSSSEPAQPGEQLLAWELRSWVYCRARRQA